MRIIEPHQLRRKSVSNQKRHLKIGFASFIIVIISGLLWYSQRPLHKSSGLVAESASTPAATIISEESPASDKQTLKTFTPDQFRDLYRSIAYPNIQEITRDPSITGNSDADARIIEIAKRRGYRRTSIPVAPIIKINEPNLEGDDLLQPKAYEGWKLLKELAAKEGVPLKLLSAYRSPDYQRTLFTQRLYATGATVESIIAGSSDWAIERTLQLTAVPGRSRHHTGYTVDLLCDPGYYVQFEDSVCFRWISAENYKNAKLTGWVPSYPSGTTEQGPEPEAWEYVWVGSGAVSN